MEENEKSGYSAEGRKLRPRRQRVPERAYSSSDRSYADNGERKEGRASYGDSDRRRSYGQDRREGGERRPYGRSYGDSDRRRSFGAGRDSDRRPSGRSYGDSDRRSYGNSDSRSYGDSDRRRSFGQDRREGGERRPYGRSFGDSDRRRSFGAGRDSDRRPSGRSYGDADRRRFSSSDEGGYRRDNQGEEQQETRRFSSEGRRFGQDRGSRGGFRFDSRRGGRSWGGKQERRGGFKKNPYSFDDDNAGIQNMINSKPQLSEAQLSDNDMAKPEIKEEIRLNKYIANSGVCSRREADQMIQAGVVTVNGEVVTELGTKVNVLKDEVKFNGETLKGEQKVYIVMNKPKGYVTTSSDAHAEKTVMELLKGCDYRVFPVGRLDKNTTGVLMFTNDGDIAEKLTHPSYNKKKIYQIILDQPVSEEDRDKILNGITLNDGDIKADELEYIDPEDHRKMGIEIHSGKNRIVRRIFESLGYDVKALDRVYFAGLTKKGLKKGEWRYLTEGEANILKMGAYL